MPLQRPALADLITRVTQQLETRVAALAIQPLTLAYLLLRSCIGVLAKVLGQELNLEYGYLQNIATQFFIRTATGGYLDDRGNPYGVFRKAAATAGGTALATGIAGYLIPAGLTAQTQDSTLAFTLGAGTIATGGTATLTVSAQIGGAASNLPAGTILVLATAVPGVNATLAVQAALTGGLDQETDDSYRARILQRTQQPPQGGANTDYVAWAKLVPGVTRAWVYPAFYGIGTVAVAPVLDGRAPGSILPLPADIAEVDAVLDADAPVIGSSSAIVLATDPIPVALTGLTAQAGYTATQALANATASLQALFAAVTPGGAAYGDGVTAGTTPGKLFLADVNDAIKQSAGVAEFDLTAPAADYQAALAHLPVLGTVTSS